jgi:S-DNA-T family DNA segregation ATPase FtsK/SpoIIIE
MALGAESVRIIAPLPGKSVVGIEIPNAVRETVYFKDIIESDGFGQAAAPLTLALGEDIIGKSVSANLAKMPHLLIAGATGSGKSVGLNTMISSILFKSTPDEVNFIMIDPKMLELSPYAGIPHLLHPIVTDAKQAAEVLAWAVKEMERRYQMMADKGVRNLGSYNDESGDGDKLPHIVVIIDELADLMVVAKKEVETSIVRLAQMARAAGIHMIVATQRPSVDVLTGLIKANFPARMSFQVSSGFDSQTILGRIGAERLLGNGDMLFLPPGTDKVQRIHGAYINDDEIEALVEYLKTQGAPQYVDINEDTSGDDSSEEYDDGYERAINFLKDKNTISLGQLKRDLGLGYQHAARIMERLELDGVVGGSDDSGLRRVVIIQLDKI